MDLDPLPPEAANITPNAEYEHYKGGKYKAIAVGRHSETLEPMVLYVSLTHGTYWARPLSEWTKPLPDGSLRFKAGPITLFQKVLVAIFGCFVAVLGILYLPIFMVCTGIKRVIYGKPTIPPQDGVFRTRAGLIRYVAGPGARSLTQEDIDKYGINWGGAGIDEYDDKGKCLKWNGRNLRDGDLVELIAKIN